MPLLQATYALLAEMVSSNALLRHRILFVDAWFLSLCGPNNLDGNHYGSEMQTALWSVLAYALHHFQARGMDTTARPL